MNASDNEHVTLHELRGFLADDLLGAFQEAEAISSGTKCRQYLFSLSLNPPQPETVPIEVFERAIAEIERRLGLSGQPRAIVFHEKNGRRHAHCVWSRIDAAQMKAINLAHTKYRLRDMSRDLYMEHGWDMPAGLRNPEDRDPLNYGLTEASQSKRVKRDPRELKALFAQSWEISDSKEAFAAALRDHGFVLARGSRRGFVAIDARGEVYSLSRWCGVKTKDLRARLGDQNDLPNVQDAIEFWNAQVLNNGQTSIADEAIPKARRDFETQLSELVSRQRKERTDLEEALETRRLDHTKATQKRLPNGLKATWAKLTGQYQIVVDDIARDAEMLARTQQSEREVLIRSHLAERRSLEREWQARQDHNVLWQEFEAVAHDGSLSVDPRQFLVLPSDNLPPFTREKLLDQPDLILDHISERQAQFTQTDILRALSGQIDDPVQLRFVADLALRSDKLVALVSDDGEIRYTTRDFQAAENHLVGLATAMADAKGFRVSKPHIDRAIHRQNKALRKSVDAELSDEQIAAIRHVLKPSQLSAVVGLAGAGKSTLLSVAREAWQLQGYKVYGAALAGKAADGLQSASGIESRTLASLETSWKAGYEPIERGSILVIDEVGMVGTRQLARVTTELQKRDCKLVLVGDPDQLQPIEAGTPFRDLLSHIDAAKLTEIRRQQSDWQKQASVSLARGDTNAAFAGYSEHGRVQMDYDNQDAAIAALAEDYWVHRTINEDSSSRLALAHRRRDVFKINQSIRALRKSEGELENEILFDTETGPRAFAAGDRIVLTRNNAVLDVRNGMLGTVEHVDEAQITIHLDAADGSLARQVKLSPSDYPAIDHGYATTIHKSQGATVDQAFVLGSRTMDQHLAYVAMTRHKADMSFYASKEDLPKFCRQVSQTDLDDRREQLPRYRR
ncbi:AAA family ATPase [Halovulum sp. GXIMD14793]